MATKETPKQQKSAAGLRIWILEARPQFLILPVVLVMLGTSASLYYEDIFNPWIAVLAFLGLLLCHISVNVLNDYFDYKSGVDLRTVKTPFNGGSGILPAGDLKPGQVLRYGLISFMLAVPIGVYFTIVHGWLLVPLLIIGALCILLYTPLILKIPFPEWSPGLGLGICPVMGAYYVQAGTYSYSALIISIPSGILVLCLLLLNEFLDTEADKFGNKKTLPIILGKQKAAVVYAAFIALVFLWILVIVSVGIMPIYCLLALLILPLAYKAIRGSFAYHHTDRFIGAMRDNVLVVLGTQALLALGFIIASYA